MQGLNVDYIDFPVYCFIITFESNTIFPLLNINSSEQPYFFELGLLSPELRLLFSCPVARSRSASLCHRLASFPLTMRVVPTVIPTFACNFTPAPLVVLLVTNSSYEGLLNLRHCTILTKLRHSCVTVERAMDSVFWTRLEYNGQWTCP